ncbi:MAG: hypothetical protein ACLQVJ_13855 [Syntrophobacteraceae bacterium]
MSDRSDEIFLYNALDADRLHPLPARSMRDGLLGKTLEDALQNLLGNYPQIIPGKQIDPVSEEPPRFVLLRREMPIGGWSLDHLYVDQRAILTLVETKLVQNPESRREVIGQVIEYAANAAELWATGRTRQYAFEFWSKQGKDLDTVLQKEFGADLDIETFWNSIERNLSDGRIRLIIAADEMRPEVRRMIEFLNREMKNAEILGLEIKCYGDDQTSMVLVPRLVGQTIIDRPPLSKNLILWDQQRLRTAYEQLADESLRERLLTVLNWAVSNKFFIESRSQFPGFGLRGKNKSRILGIYSNGTLFPYLREKYYHGGAEERDQLCDELKQLGMMDQNLDPQTIVDGRNLTRKLTDLSDEELEAFLDLYCKYSA